MIDEYEKLLSKAIGETVLSNYSDIVDYIIEKL
jgi:hypothetical protein